MTRLGRHCRISPTVWARTFIFITLCVSELHSLIRIIHVPENLKCQKGAHLRPTLIPTCLTSNQPNGSNLYSDPQIIYLRLIV